MIKVKDNWIILNERKCGVIQEGKYVSVRYPKKHYFIKGNSYPISTEILNWLREHGINDILIVEKCIKGDKHWNGTVAQYLDGADVKEGDFEHQKSVPLSELTQVN